jgi:hypothetical protein
MAQLRDIVIDCSHPASLARFWAAALDGYAIAPYDDAEIARLFLQLVPETKQAKNRCHLDLAAPHIEDEVERLIGLGASVVERHESHVTLTDPQGN